MSQKKQQPEKATTLFLGLFGKPAWELEGLEGCEVSPKLLKKIENLGKRLNERLQLTARTGRQLLNHGWDGYGTLYDIMFYKLISVEEAKKEFKELGLNSDEFDLHEEKLEAEFGLGE